MCQGHEQPQRLPGKRLLQSWRGEQRLGEKLGFTCLKWVHENPALSFSPVGLAEVICRLVPCSRAQMALGTAQRAGSSKTRDPGPCLPQPPSHGGPPFTEGLVPGWALVVPLDIGTEVATGISAKP